ncbi:MAG: DUF488 domain-containing protein [Chloroflexi bacterium]|nr:DUF488 domain-containing protein [Chloroflexota bacterium]
MAVDTLRLPEKAVNEQKRGKLDWNLKHCASVTPDFYTIGYSGKGINSFVDTLKKAGVMTLVDIRYAPVSRFRPEFSKNNLKRALEKECISYIHRADWGVPRDIRAYSVGKQDRNDIWAWYDANVLPSVAKKNLDEFFNSMEHPVAFMCVEYDPTECHRHRVFLGLEQLGFTGCEL